MPLKWAKVGLLISNLEQSSKYSLWQSCLSQMTGTRAVWCRHVTSCSLSGPLGAGDLHPNILTVHSGLVQAKDNTSHDQHSGIYHRIESLDSLIFQDGYHKFIHLNCGRFHQVRWVRWPLSWRKPWWPPPTQTPRPPKLNQTKPRTRSPWRRI